MGTKLNRTDKIITYELIDFLENLKHKINLDVYVVVIDFSGFKLRNIVNREVNNVGDEVGYEIENNFSYDLNKINESS